MEKAGEVQVGMQSTYKVYAFQMWKTSAFGLLDKLTAHRQPRILAYTCSFSKQRFTSTLISPMLMSDRREEPSPRTSLASETQPEAQQHNQDTPQAEG